MAANSVPKRLILCVDGTYCTADGPHGKGAGNISNVYRICASVKVGFCQDPLTGRGIEQVKHYEAGIGSADELGSWSRVRAGIYGTGFEDIIRQLYEKCCLLDSQDEIWLYGFSRGAYIARAVAGLLEYLGSLSSAGTPEFQTEYRRALEIYGNSAKKSTVGPGQIHSFLSLKTKPMAKIQFIGVFDTVKAVEDGNLYDISFNNEIQHLRHALALNENRLAMTPEYLYPDIRTIKGDRSIIQAWFAGAHIDMGGSAKRDGLSLYPLQWMLLESQKKGLVLEFCHDFDNKSKIDNPLQVVFPEHELEGKGVDMWSCTTKNGIKLNMQDLRKIHELERYHRRYSLELNIRPHHFWPKGPREIFNSDKTLRGYCSFAPHGTVIHPSVYQLLDSSQVISLHKKAWMSREEIENCRADMLGKMGPNNLLNQGFWYDREDTELEDLKSLRILVCGNTGIGKSTLINLVFGVDVTEVSDRDRGVHQVTTPIIHPDRPDLIVHDSGGFEAGGHEEIRDVEEFVKSKASCINLKDRLHVIWFCVEMNTDRVKQVATRDLFHAVSKHAIDVPIIIVATKSDQFIAGKFQECRALRRSSGLGAAELMEVADQYAKEQIQPRLDVIEEELSKVEGGRCDGCVAVNKDDPESVQHLTEITWNCFSNENVRLVYVAAQTANVDKKIDLSIMEIMRIYRSVLGTASGLGLFPAASTINRTAAAYSICKGIVKCFGLPTLDSETVFEIVKNNVWDDLKHNICIAFAEGIAAVGLLGTLASGVPFVAVSGLINIPLVVPATTRLMLMLAGDLILTLTRAFKKTTFTCVGQPLFADVRQAAIQYRGLSNQVHKEILAIVPKRNLIQSYRINKVREALQRIVYKYKDQVAADIESSVPVIGLPQDSRRQDVKEVEDEIEAMEKDIPPSLEHIIEKARQQGSLPL